MLRQLVLGSLIVVTASASALANGRPPGTSTITFRKDNEQHIVAGLTFGLAISHDGGATWSWMCEDAIRYGGMWDPDYGYSASGALFATTFNGALVNRNGCDFEPTAQGALFMTTLEIGPNDAVYTAAMLPPDTLATPPVAGDSKIYKSIDDGVTFPTSSLPPGAIDGDWWNSLKIAPSNAQRVYLSGYRLVDSNRTFLLYRSNDGGATWTAMSLTGLTTTRNSSIDIVGISKLDPDMLYVRITYQNENAIGDAVFRSTDAGASWTKILTKQDDIAFVVRANGDLVAGTKNSGVFTSTAASNGDAWTELTGAPHVGCLVENSAGEVWACTQNFGANQVPSDDAGIMKSTDLVTWTKVMRYQDLAGPVMCAPGTPQHDSCGISWCIIRRQFGIVADPTACPSLVESDAPVVKPPDGCCDSSGSPGTLAIGSVVGMVLMRRRRRP